MKKSTRLILIVILIVAGFAGLKAFYNNNKDKVETNTTTQEKQLTTAYDFKVHDLNGKNVYLEDFHDGKVIVLNFWTSTCPPCRQEMPDYQELYEKYKDDVHFVMINCVGALGETKQGCLDFITENNYTFPVYLDENKEAIMAYGISSFPTTIVVNKKFELYAGGVGAIDPEVVSDILDELIHE